MDMDIRIETDNKQVLVKRRFSFISMLFIASRLRLQPITGIFRLVFPGPLQRWWKILDPHGKQLAHARSCWPATVPNVVRRNCFKETWGLFQKAGFSEKSELICSDLRFKSFRKQVHYNSDSVTPAGCRERMIRPD